MLGLGSNQGEGAAANRLAVGESGAEEKSGTFEAGQWFGYDTLPEPRGVAPA